QGAIPPATLYDLKGQLANDQLAISAARNTLATAEVNFCRLLNIPYQRQLQLQRIEIPPATFASAQSVDSVYHSALQSFALIKASEQWARSAKYGYKAEKGRLLPTLSLNAGANTNYSSAARDNKIIGVQDV